MAAVLSSRQTTIKMNAFNFNSIFHSKNIIEEKFSRVGQNSVKTISYFNNGKGFYTSLGVWKHFTSSG